MKRLFNCSICLLLLSMASSKAIAQAANSATDNKKNVKAIASTITMDRPDDSSVINNDAAQATSTMEVYPNPTTGMLTVKTVCAGKLFFYNQRGKEKASCIVKEGVNPIYLQEVLFPGTYICKFEGVNGSTAEIKVTYKL